MKGRKCRCLQYIKYVADKVFSSLILLYVPATRVTHTVFDMILHMGTNYILPSTTVKLLEKQSLQVFAVCDSKERCHKIKVRLPEASPKFLTMMKRSKE